MPSSSTIIPIRLKVSLAERVKAAAARSGRPTSRYITDILGALLGDAAVLGDEEPRG